MWKLEDEDGSYKILDKNNDIAGYFDPNILEFQQKITQPGNINMEDDEQIIEEMKKNNVPIQSGFITLPLTKFGLLNQDEPYSISYLHEKLAETTKRVVSWEKCLDEIGHDIPNWIQTSHTDSDMLSLTIFIQFRQSVSFRKDQILQEIRWILNIIHQNGLL